MAGNQKERVIGAVLGYLGIGVSIITGFLSVSLLTRCLGQSEYGVYSLVASMVGYISIMDFGMHNVTIRYITIYKAQSDWSGQSHFLGLTVKIYFFIDLIAAIIGLGVFNSVPYIFEARLTAPEIELTQKLFLVLLINLLISMPGAVFEACLIAYEKFVYVKSLSLLKLVMKLILMSAILLTGGRSLALVFLDTFLNISVLLAEIVYCFSGLKISIDYSARLQNNPLLKKIVLFTSFVFIASISDQINWKADGIILGIIEGAKAVGISAVGMQLMSVYRSVTSVVSSVYLPQVTNMVITGKSNKELTDIMIRVGQIQLALVGLILCGFFTVGKSFIVFWAGKEYVDAYWVFAVLAVSLIVPSTQSIGINILEAKNMHKFRAKVYLGISVLNILLTVFLVKKYSVIGAALGTAMAMIVGNTIIINIYYWKAVRLEIPRFFCSVFGREFLCIVSSTIVSVLLYKMALVRVEIEIVKILAGAMISLFVYIINMVWWGLPKEIKKEISSMKVGSKLR